MQALEALHGTLHRTDDDERQQRYAERRTKALEEIATSNLDNETKRFLRKRLSARRPDNFQQRLTALLAAVPPRVAGAARDLVDTQLGGKLVQAGVEAQAPALLAELRNRLAHGRNAPGHQELVEWLAPVEATARVHLLRRLGVPEDTLTYLAERSSS